MQRRHEEKQQLQACLKEVAEACHIKYATQKARKAAEVKVREKAEKRRIVKEKRKKKQIKYL